MKYLHKGQKITLVLLEWFCKLHKMFASFFGWFVQYPNVGHKICMFNENNDLGEKEKEHLKGGF